MVPLVSDRDRRRSRVVISYDPNAIIFEFVVDPWTESSGDSNLVGCGCGDHVGISPGVIIAGGNVTRPTIGERISCACNVWWPVLVQDQRVEVAKHHVTVTSRVLNRLARHKRLENVLYEGAPHGNAELA